MVEKSSLFDVRAVPERVPLATMVIVFSLIAIIDWWRGLQLWATYATTGVGFTLFLCIFLWNGKLRIPPLSLWLGGLALFFHFGGGSLGAADRGPGPFCFDGYYLPGQALCADGINGMYHVHEMWDGLTHGLGGVAVAMGWLLSWRRLSAHNGWNLSNAMLYWLGFSFAVASMTAFEVYEFFGKTFFLTIDQGGYANTAGDLLSDIVGAACGAYLGLTIERGEEDNEGQSAWPWPWPVWLNQSFSLPLVAAGLLGAFDYIILGGAILGSDYDRLGAFLLASMVFSLLLLGIMIALRPWRWDAAVRSSTAKD